MLCDEKVLMVEKLASASRWTRVVGFSHECLWPKSRSLHTILIPTSLCCFRYSLVLELDILELDRASTLKYTLLDWKWSERCGVVSIARTSLVCRCVSADGTNGWWLVIIINIFSISRNTKESAYTHPSRNKRWILILCYLAFCIGIENSVQMLERRSEKEKAEG